MAKRTLTQLVDAVVLRGHIARADIEDEIIDFLNEGYMELSDLDLACFETTAPLTLSASVREYTISTAIADNVRKIIGINSTYGHIDLIDPHRARTVYYNQLSDSTYTETPDYPNVAWEYEGKLYLNINPDQSYTTYVDYYQIPDRVEDLALTFLIPAHKEILLVDYARKMLDAREKDWDAADRILSEFMMKARKWEVKDKNRYGRQTDLIELQAQYNETYNGGKWN